MDPDPVPRKEIEVDPDLDLERGLKWIRIQILPNAVDSSGSGSETLLHIRAKSLSLSTSLIGENSAGRTSLSVVGVVTTSELLDCLEDYLEYLHKSLDSW